MTFSTAYCFTACCLIRLLFYCFTTAADLLAVRGRRQDNLNDIFDQESLVETLRAEGRVVVKKQLDAFQQLRHERNSLGFLDESVLRTRGLFGRVRLMRNVMSVSKEPTTKRLKRNDMFL
jgi:hypothetical protein